MRTSPGVENGKKIKLVIWDLDNTIWTGILAEGDAVTLRDSVRPILETLDKRGILCSIASRNDADRAGAQLNAFGIGDFFVGPMINWKRKSQNVSAITRRLNLSLDVTLFVDDDPFERDEVSYAHPEVRTLDAAEVPRMLQRPDLTPVRVTAEALRRRQLYQAELRRLLDEESFDGPSEAFLETLGMVLTIRRAQQEDLERAEELIERTNQLNATGRVYRLEELDAFRKASRHLLLVAELSDRYGDYGVIGLALIDLDGGKRTIRLVLLSCRVLSRGISSVFIREIVADALEAGDTIYADLIRTGRNRPMEVALRFAGFEIVDATSTPIILKYASTSPMHQANFAKITWLR